MSRSPKNIWVAAGDGDLDRVSVFQLPEYARRIDNQNLHLALSPNTPDPNTYTPMHAAASYGHIPVLEYLISRGGDVNVTDSDGDTPLYTVENIDTARWLVEHGAVVARRNLEGVSVIDHLTDDFPHIADYLRSTLDPAAVLSTTSTSSLSQHSQEAASEQLTSSLMSSVQEIMERAEAEGHDPEEELRRAVAQHVYEGVATGFEMSTEEDGPRGNGDGQENTPSKRSRTDGSG